MKNGKPIHRAIALLAVLTAALPQTSQACAVCMGASDSAVAPAINAAIFLMLGFVGIMLGGAGGFAFYLFRRGKLPAPPHEELTQMICQEGSRNHA